MNSLKQGGRPTKKLSEVKGYRANCKMSTEDYYTLRAKAKEAGVSISEYIRLAISDSVIKQRVSPELLDIIRKLSGMANNLNQVARTANTYGYTDARKDYLLLAEKIDDLLNLIQR